VRVGIVRARHTVVDDRPGVGDSRRRNAALEVLGVLAQDM
jgi:hypothetical protein